MKPKKNGNMFGNLKVKKKVETQESPKKPVEVEQGPSPISEKGFGGLDFLNKPTKSKKSQESIGGDGSTPGGPSSSTKKKGANPFSFITKSTKEKSSRNTSMIIENIQKDSDNTPMSHNNLSFIKNAPPAGFQDSNNNILEDDDERLEDNNRQNQTIQLPDNPIDDIEEHNRNKMKDFINNASDSGASQEGENRQNENRDDSAEYKTNDYDLTLTDVAKRELNGENDQNSANTPHRFVRQ